MSGPAVSVVLPFRDAAATLPATLDSIARQTLDTYEVVAIDDGSTDSSAALMRAKAREDPRIRVLANDGRGLVAALNQGLSTARAETIARMDADDTMHPERLARQTEAMQRDPAISVLGCRVSVPDGDRPTDGLREYLRWQNACVTERDILDEIYVESPLAHPSVCLRRADVLALGGYRDGDFPEDYDLWLRCAQRGLRMAKLPDALLAWRDRPDRLSRTDPRYARGAFDRLRAEYLAKDPRVRAARDRLVCWGAGRPTRRRVALLMERGFAPRAWIDIDPRKIGNRINGVPVVSPQALEDMRDAFVLSYVTNHGARELIARQLEQLGWVRGDSYLSVG